MTAHPSDRFALVSSLVTPLDADDLGAVAQLVGHVGTLISAQPAAVPVTRPHG
jgi:hypothetical protein